jgi:lysophospholipase L1-like esterase
MSGSGGSTAGSGGGQLPTAGTSGGGSGGSSGYQPCPTDGSACVILPFGDSITDGVGSSNLAGYRAPLFALAVQANQKITFVGSRSSGPDQVSSTKFPKNHEGHPGWTIDSGYVSFGEGISTLIPMPAFKTIPDIVLLMIGTNDVSADKGTDKIAERLETLLDKIVQAAPDALIVVAKPTPISWNPAALGTYNSKIPGIVQARAAKGQHMLSVDMSKMPASNLASDGLHPNDQGYAYMAEVWYAAVKDFFPR